MFLDAEIGIDVHHHIGKIGEGAPRDLTVEVIVGVAGEAEVRPVGPLRASK
jgi:hypothetical protein